MKIKPKYYLILLAVLGLILIGFGVSQSLNIISLPPFIEKNLPNAIIIIALGVFLLNRQSKKIEEREKAEEELSKKITKND